VVGPGGMAAAQYVEPVGGAFRTEIVGMVRVLQGNPTGLLSSFQLVESDGRTRFLGDDRGIVGPPMINFTPVGLLNETGRLAAFNNSTQTAVLDLDIINIANNTLLATFKGGVLPPHSSISVQAVVGGTRTEVVGTVRVLSGSLINVISSFQIIGADNRARLAECVAYSR
jgi:FAD/FMN-containing dehydrogenase